MGVAEEQSSEALVIVGEKSVDGTKVAVDLLNHVRGGLHGGQDAAELWGEVPHLVGPQVFGSCCPPGFMAVPIGAPDDAGPRALKFPQVFAEERQPSHLVDPQLEKDRVPVLRRNVPLLQSPAEVVALSTPGRERGLELQVALPLVDQHRDATSKGPFFLDEEIALLFHQRVFLPFVSRAQIGMGETLPAKAMIFYNDYLSTLIQFKRFRVFFPDAH